MITPLTEADSREANWKSLYQLGGAAALIVVLVALSEIFITFLPGGGRMEPGAATVSDWFTLLQHNWFLGLRNLGLLNIVMTTLGIPIFFALYGAHRRVNQPYAALALLISLLGVAVFYATNRAFPLLELSRQYAAATTEAQRAMVVAAGQAMLAVGQSHTPGTFLAFFLLEVAGLLISLVMLQSKVFSTATAYTGILGFGLLFLFELCSSFVPVLFNMAILFALAGGLFNLVWYILVARRLFQLGHRAGKLTPQPVSSEAFV